MLYLIRRCSGAEYVDVITQGFSSAYLRHPSQLLFIIQHKLLNSGAPESFDSYT